MQSRYYGVNGSTEPRFKRFFFIFTFLLLLIPPGLLRASWVPDNGSLNIDVNRSALAPSVSIDSSTPFVAWQENNGTAEQIYVRFYNGFGWQPCGGSLNQDVNRSAANPSLAFNGSTPYIAWQETDGINNKIWVRYYDGFNWQPQGAQLNVDANRSATNPSLAVNGGVPYVAWNETTAGASRLYVKRYSGGLWQLCGSYLNYDANYSALNPSLAFSGSTPYVAWQESDGLRQHVWVKYYDGASWQPCGSFLNVDANRNATNPSICADSGIPAVAWQEETVAGPTSVYVKYYSGGAWYSRGTYLNADVNRSAANPSSVFYAGTQYVAWQESGSGQNFIYVKYYNGSSWALDGTYLNYDVNASAVNPSLAQGNYYLFAGWSEGAPARLYIKHHAFPTPTPTTTVSPTATTTATGTSTSTPTMTSTPTPTPTTTPTWTASVTSTVTSTATASETGTPPDTTTVTSTPTQTASPSAFATVLSTASPTVTQTCTVWPRDPRADDLLRAHGILVYPNPAREHVRFVIETAQAAEVTIDIFNPAGERIAGMRGSASQGPELDLLWDCHSVASGIYLARVRMNGVLKASVKFAVIK